MTLVLAPEALLASERPALIPLSSFSARVHNNIMILLRIRVLTVDLFRVPSKVDIKLF